jgi:hypothetical protein
MYETPWFVPTVIIAVITQAGAFGAWMGSLSSEVRRRKDETEAVRETLKELQAAFYHDLSVRLQAMSEDIAVIKQTCQLRSDSCGVPGKALFQGSKGG